MLVTKTSIVPVAIAALLCVGVATADGSTTAEGPAATSRGADASAPPDVFERAVLRRQAETPPDAFERAVIRAQEASTRTPVVDDRRLDHTIVPVVADTGPALESSISWEHVGLAFAAGIVLALAGGLAVRATRGRALAH